MGGRFHACAIYRPPCAERAWYKSMFRGKYTGVRILTSAMDLVLFAVMICLTASGIIMSRHVFAFLPISGGMGSSKADPHDCLLLGIHTDVFPSGTPLGHDAGAVPADVRDGQELRNPPYGTPDCRRFNCRLRPVCICDKKSGDLHVPEDTVCVPGLQRVPISFYIDYLSMLGLFIWIAYYLSVILLKLGRRSIIPETHEK